MNKYFTAFAVVLALLVASCQIPLAGTGSLRIQVPSVGRDLASPGDKVRIQLVHNGAVVPLSGKSFLEDGLAGQTITVDGIPTGNGYVLNLATGTITGGFFTVNYFNASPAFEVTAGTDTAVSVVLKPTTVKVFASGTGPFKSVVIPGTTESLAVTKNGKLQTGSTQAGLTDAGATFSAGGTWNGRNLNSLGYSYDSTETPFVTFNTDNGLGKLDGSAFDFSMLDKNGAALSSLPNIKRSFAGVNNGKIFHIYVGTGLTAGMAITDGDDTDGPHWNDLEKLLELPKDITESLSSGDGLFLGFASTGKFAYISTVLGVFRIDSAALGDIETLADQFKSNDNSIKVSVEYGGRTLLVKPVGAYFAGSSGLAFAGTSKGLFSSTTDSAGIPAGLTLVDGTFGLNIAEIATKGFGSGTKTAYTAAWAKNTGDLLILSGQGQILQKIPALAGLPTGKLSLSWWNEVSGSTHTLKLVVSGDDSTVIIDVASYTDEV